MASSSSGADSDVWCVFELLHAEMVRTFLRSPTASHEQSVSKLEQLGWRVGSRLGEQLTRDRLRYCSELDVMKYVCKDFWLFLFHKQVGIF